MHTITFRKIILISLLVALSISRASTVSAGNNVWTSIGLEGGYIHALAIDPATSTTLYAGGAKDWLFGVFKSTNGGGNWNAMNTGLTNTDVNALAIDPTTPTILYAGTGDGVFKSTNGGGNWNAMNTGLTNTDVRHLAIDPATPTILYAVVWPGIFTGKPGGVFKSTNSGGNWSQVFSAIVRTLVIDPVTPTILYAGLGFSDGVYKSTNGGGNWSAVNTGLPTSSDMNVDSLVIDPVTPNTLFAGTLKGEVFKSTNSGGNWSVVSTDLPSGMVDLVIDPVTPTILYAGTEGGVFKSTNGGGNWNAMNTGLTYTDVHTLVIDPTSPTILYAGTANGVFAIQQPNPMYSISGYVVDGGGNGIPGVTVSGGAGHTVLTDSSGYYILSGFETGVYAITPSASGYSFNPIARAIYIVNGNMTGINFTGTLSTFTASGHITLNGTGLGGVLVANANGFTTTTANDGSYILSGLLPGIHTLTPSMSGFIFSPVSRSVSVPPDGANQDFTAQVTYSISGRVVDGSSNGVAGVSVSAAAGISTVTDGLGYYSISTLPSGRYVLTAAKTGYSFSPAWINVSLPPDQAGNNFIGVSGNTPPPGPTDPPAAPQSGIPYVSNVQPCISGPYYFRPWIGSITNTYTATINWQGLAPYQGLFNFNGNTVAESTGSSTASHDYSLNSFNYNIFGAQNFLSVQSQTAGGLTSQPYSLNPVGVDFPVWLPYNKMTLSAPADCGQPMKAKFEILFPEPALTFMYTPPVWFPIIGGQEFRIRETQAGLEGELEGSGQGSLTIFGQTGFKAASQIVTGKVYGKGDGLIDPQQGIKLQNASFGLEIEGTIQTQKPVADIICKAFTAGTCPLQEWENTPVVGGVIKWFNDKAKVKAEIKPDINLAANFHSNSSGLAFDTGTAEGKVKLTLSQLTDAIKDILTAEVYGGGEPSLTFQFPASPSYLKGISLELFAGLKLKVLDFERKLETNYTTSFSPSSSQDINAEMQTPAIKGHSDSGWQISPRDYVSKPGQYAAFHANEQPIGENSTLGPNIPLTTRETLISSNVYPQGHPSTITTPSGEIFLVWVHDDVNKPVMQGKEIYFSHFAGTSWSTPAGITNDNVQDFSPQVALDQNNHPVVVWERSNTIQPDTVALDAAYTNTFEIAFSAWNGSSWSAPVLLTTNTIFDHAPILTRGNDGKLLLVWRQNAAGELIGSTASPDTLYSQVWDGTSWSVPQLVLTNAPYILAMSAARKDGTTMGIVYSQDTDGDLSTNADQELYLINFDSSSWSTPARLTNDIQPDNHPTLIYSSVDGSPRLLWLKGDTLFALLGNLSGVPQSITVEESSAIMDYVVAQDASGGLALLWQGLSSEGVDIFYSTYDPMHNSFSLVEQLTHDQPLEKFLSATFDSNGGLVLAYNKAQLENVTETPQLGVTITGVTEFGTTDLYVLRHTFGPDLSLQASDLSISPTNPSLGSQATFTATLHNLGDQAVSDPSIAFYLGDPANNGVLLGTADSSQILAGGASVQISINWTIPGNGSPFIIYAEADPNHQVSEINESNNSTYFSVALPDLTATNVKADYGLGQTINLTTTVENIGVTSADSSTLSFRLDDPQTGTLLGSVSLPSLAASSQTDVVFTWDATSTPAGSYTVYAVVDPNNTITEANETNNTKWAEVGILPDLALKTQAVVTTLNADGSLTVNVWVFNNGLRPANGITVGVYNQSPTIGSIPLFSTTASIPAGESRVVTFNLGDYLWKGFYLGAGFDLGFEDRNISDNRLGIGQPPLLIFFPTIRK